MRKIVLILALFVLMFGIAGCSDILGPDSNNKEKLYSISGKILDWPTRVPVVNHTIRMWDGGFWDEFEETTKMYYTQTDNTWSYFFTGLKNGKYTVYCEAIPEHYSYGSWQKTVEINGKNLTVDFWRCYLGNCHP